MLGKLTGQVHPSQNYMLARVSKHPFLCVPWSLSRVWVSCSGGQLYPLPHTSCLHSVNICTSILLNQTQSIIPFIFTCVSKCGAGNPQWPSNPTAFTPVTNKITSASFPGKWKCISLYTFMIQDWIFTTGIIMLLDFNITSPKTNRQTFKKKGKRSMNI